MICDSCGMFYKKGRFLVLNASIRRVGMGGVGGIIKVSRLAGVSRWVIMAGGVAR